MAVLEALSGRTCALVANHGMVATGPDLREAMRPAAQPSRPGPRLGKAREPIRVSASVQGPDC